MRFAVDRLDHLVITCNDVETSASWYQRVLGMERDAFGEQNRTAMRFGGQKLNLRPLESTQENWFTGLGVSAGDIVEHLQSCGVAIILGPVAKAGALGPITSVYCRDPDGNLIEIATYGEGRF